MARRAMDRRAGDMSGSSPQMSNETLAGKFDGPGSESGQGTQAMPSSSASRHGSPKPAPTTVNRRGINLPRDIDLGSDAWRFASPYLNPHLAIKRPGFCDVGKGIMINVNSYRVTSYPTKRIQQYDVLIGSGDEKRGLVKAIWETNRVKQALGEHGWIFDGNKLAWSTAPNVEVNITVDMDVEKGRPSKGNNTHRVQVRPTSQINLAELYAYLQGKTDFGSPVLEAINFLDHLLRDWPSKRLLAIKRSFFDPANWYKSFSLTNGVHAYKGVYQSLRTAHDEGNFGKVVINADVANTCFWPPKPLSDIASDICQPIPTVAIVNSCQPYYPPRSDKLRDTQTYLNLKKLFKLRFRVEYLNMSDRTREKTFVIKTIRYTHPKTTKFTMRDRNTGLPRELTVYDYFLETYKTRPQMLHLPVVETTKGVLYPMEYCSLLPGQRYPFRLNDFQIGEMIKFAVTKPAQRAAAINQGLDALAWNQDPNLKHYGMSIDRNMIKTKARLLDPPKVEFGKGKVEMPKTEGRWRIDGKPFIEKNRMSLDCWGVIVFNDWSHKEKLDNNHVNIFLQDFMKLYRQYGGEITQHNPPVYFADDADIAEGCLNGVKVIAGGKRDKTNVKPQFALIMVNAKNTVTYNRVKKSMDCRFGMVSQVVQSRHVKVHQAQYIGNVLMKVNAKLGGFSFRALPLNAQPNSGFTYFKRPTIVIGADVSHAGPGSLQASMAAMTVSMDRFGAKYLATCQTNGHRTEMISTWNIDEMLKPLFKRWLSTVSNGMFPKHVIYMRDGVSEGQHEHVMKQEVRDIRKVWSDLADTDQAKYNDIKFTVIVASKRHHTRFFPGQTGDKSGNPFPGTLVERDVTHPRDWDFFLCAHKAIQGTARPVHYHVIHDEAKMNPSELITMLYHQSYSYVRSSTPVSLHPAIYYAHLASKRAVAHERGEVVHHPGELREQNEILQAKIIADQTGKKFSTFGQKKLQEITEAQFPRLISLHAESGIKNTMWFV